MPSKPIFRHLLAPAFAAAILLAAAAATAAGPEAPKAQSPQAAPAQQPAAPAQADAKKAKVVLYSTAWCGYCRKTRELLNHLQVPFVEKDIEKSPEGHAEYQAKGKGFRGVPLTDIDGTLVKGYVPEDVKKLVIELQKKEAAAKSAR